MGEGDRIVVLIDMDCFYCQVEEKLDPNLQGKPIAVVQYNPWKGGGIIAVNYVARAMGVTRHMRGDEAKEKCPEIELPSVPCRRGKADITKYRDAGKEVAIVLQRFTNLLERASIDEAYLDITNAVHERSKSQSVDSITQVMLQGTYALGYDNLNQLLDDVQKDGNGCIEFDCHHTKQLLIGAVIVNEIRAAVYNETGYRCSAGIAHNKILSKLVCGMNKPNKQTVLPKHCINLLYRTLPLKKIKHLGGKFGVSVCSALKISTMSELQKFTEQELKNIFDDKNGTWLYNIALGIDTEAVQAKFNPKSIGCCKQFKGKSALTDLANLQKWLHDLADEIEDRLDKDALENNRTPKQMVVSFAFQVNNSRDVSSSRSYNFTNDDELCAGLFYDKAMELIMESTEATQVKDNEENRKLKAPIKFLGISIGKFEDNSDNKKTKKILDYFAAGSSKETSQHKIDNAAKVDSTESLKQKPDKEYVLQKFFNSNVNKQNENGKSNKVSRDELQHHNIETNLNKQESFFTKYLKENLNKHPRLNTQSDAEINATGKIEGNTPVCNIVEYGHETNDSSYSGSTIELEINKSISLFDNDSRDNSKVGDLRKLLTHSFNIVAEEHRETDKSGEASNCIAETNNVPPLLESILCPLCRKSVPFNQLDIHSDYHVALKLKEEDRMQLQKEKKGTTDSKMKQNCIKDGDAKQDKVTPLANFIVKIDETVPIKLCPDCGKKIPLKSFSEHMDFHEAQRVSRELNKKSTPSLGTTINKKRKLSSPKKQNKFQCRPIDSFFR